MLHTQYSFFVVFVWNKKKRTRGIRIDPWKTGWQFFQQKKYWTCFYLSHVLKLYQNLNDCLPTNWRYLSCNLLFFWGHLSCNEAPCFWGSELITGVVCPRIDSLFKKSKLGTDLCPEMSTYLLVPNNSLPENSCYAKSVL